MDIELGSHCDSTAEFQIEEADVNGRYFSLVSYTTAAYARL
jgi:hypothetical protein